MCLTYTRITHPRVTEAYINEAVSFDDVQSCSYFFVAYFVVCTCCVPMALLPRIKGTKEEYINGFLIASNFDYLLKESVINRLCL